LPGIVLAIFGYPVTMIEPRRLRVDFLLRVMERLQLEQAIAICGKAESLAVASKYDLITARAVAPLGDLWRMAGHVAKDDTIWILPKGKNAINELELARRSWQGNFTVIPSVTSADARIIVARHVRPHHKGNTRP
jgi:16S rRNA (guanine527-N7)-methyltransferase